uniref:Glycosyl transferase family 11 n=1 Tax=viral metagenome TaxID=1070528 RepID=A0A6C0F974_9ZZZZ|tara:strand:- start:4807 stop:5586 length:780 start_codon:yes stop_codon:yes gene_type:complete
MSVVCVQNIGQNGNQLFPTILACITACIHNLNVKHFTNQLVKFKIPKQYDFVYDKVIHTNNPLHNSNKNMNIVMKRTYYQNCNIFNPFRNKIKNEILDLPSVVPNKTDIVIHLRLDGFNHKGYNSHIIHPSWYINILENETFDKLYIVMATKSGRIKHKQEPHKKIYLEHFSKFNHEIISQNEYDDFNFIRKFDKIISSNSTFSWWAAFCSDASIIYLPPYWESRMTKLSTIGDVSKIIRDSYVYVNIETMEKVPITFQ